MEWIEQREAFKKVAIEQGITFPADIEAAFPLGHQIDPNRLCKWLRQLQKMPECWLPEKRYVNSFCIGADPEFVFSYYSMEEGGQVAYSASSLGLAQGPAFGMDNNGRLAEIRPHPSRSALEVVASTLAALRWLAAYKPNSLKYSWSSGAYLFSDGVGGHVHFGRKRPTREIEIRALDNICEGMIQAGMFPKAEVMLRRQGDARRQRYGMPGDYRLQKHGYEYRTYPSWLDSPELAFLTLVLSKLAVHNPELAMSIKPGPRWMQRIQNWLLYYKDHDDDARLAVVLLRRKWPVHIGGDFKARWGIGVATQNATKVGYIPITIKPSDMDKEEVFTYLRDGGLLTNRPPVPNWSPVAPPEGYYMILDMVNTHLQKGLGEFVWPLVAHKTMDIRIHGAQDRPGYVTISRNFFKLLGGKQWMRRYPDIPFLPLDEKSYNIGVGHDWRNEPARAKRVREMLLKEFPIWDVRSIKATSLEEWKKQLVPEPKKAREFVGEIIYQTGGLG